MFMRFSSVIILFLSWIADASEFKLLELHEIALDYRNFSALNDKARNFITYPDPVKEGLNLDTKVDVLKYGYCDFIIESLTTGAQYRGIGLELRLGIRVHSAIEVGLYHHSQHAIDKQLESLPKYPSEDAIQVKLYLYRRDGRNSLF